jgi:hypothetical protein
MNQTCHKVDVLKKKGRLSPLFPFGERHIGTQKVELCRGHSLDQFRDNYSAFNISLSDKRSLINLLIIVIILSRCLSFCGRVSHFWLFFFQRNQSSALQ